MGVAHEWLVKRAWRAFRKTAAFKRANPMMRRWGAPFVIKEYDDVKVWRIEGLPLYVQEVAPHVVLRTRGNGTHRFVSMHNIPEPIVCTVTVRCLCPHGHVGSCSVWPDEAQRLEIERRHNRRKNNV